MENEKIIISGSVITEEQREILELIKENEAELVKEITFTVLEFLAQKLLIKKIKEGKLI